MIAIWGSNINIIKVSPRVLYNCKVDMKTTVCNLTLSNVLKVSRGTSTAQVDKEGSNWRTDIIQQILSDVV